MKKIRVGVGAMRCANEMSGLQAEGGVVKIMAQERHSVLTNQCLERETNDEPLGRGPRGTEESFLMDSDKFIAIGLERNAFHGSCRRVHGLRPTYETIADDGDASRIRILPVMPASGSEKDRGEMETIGRCVRERRGVC